MLEMLGYYAHRTSHILGIGQDAVLAGRPDLLGSVRAAWLDATQEWMCFVDVRTICRSCHNHRSVADPEAQILCHPQTSHRDDVFISHHDIRPGFRTL